MRPLAAVALLLAGCGASVKKCKDKTLFVQVALEGAVAQADQLVVDVALDGGPPVETRLDHRPGQGGGGIEIDFPSGYPSGHSARVDVTASVGGATVGSGSTIIDSLGQGCQSATLTISAPQSGSDLSMLGDASSSGGDGGGDGGPDLAQPKPDLYSYDLAGADLVCIPSTEDCFNGVDDDCDGLADCADPDCTGGASPKASCVPDPGSFTLGTDVASPGSCPSAYPTPAPIHSNLNAGSCALGTCSCSEAANYCYAYVFDSDSDASCATSVAMYYIDTSFACQNFTSIPAGHHFKLEVQGNAGGCFESNSGDKATKLAPSWASDEQFCSGGAVGAGCNAGQLCVPAAPNHCVMKAGTQLTCPASYNLRAIHYYTGFDDSGRSCACSNCSVATPGTCTGAGALSLSSTKGCGFADFSTGNDTCNSENVSADVFGSLDWPVGTQATCNPPGTKETGITALLGEQTICCTP
jgi:hypothetical protein